MADLNWTIAVVAFIYGFHAWASEYIYYRMCKAEGTEYKDNSLLAFGAFVMTALTAFLH